MATERRWDPCVAHRGDEVEPFLAEYFADANRTVLFIAGAGFDPRSTAVATRLAQAGATVRAVLFQENRPKPMQRLVERATANVEALTSALANHSIVPVEIFGADNAVVGGRNVVTMLNQQNFEGVSDLVVDLSALSVGTSFPIVRYLVERIERGKGLPNLHLFVAHDPALDSAIQSTPSDAPGYVHGFRGGSTLDGVAAAAKLWLPQLASGRGGALGRLHTFVDPHDTCPILPFPAADPRLGDRLVEEFLTGSRVVCQ